MRSMDWAIDCKAAVSPSTVGIETVGERSDDFGRNLEVNELKRRRMIGRDGIVGEAQPLIKSACWF